MASRVTRFDRRCTTSTYRELEWLSCRMDYRALGLALPSSLLFMVHAAEGDRSDPRSNRGSEGIAFEMGTGVAPVQDRQPQGLPLLVRQT